MKKKHINLFLLYSNIFNIKINYLLFLITKKMSSITENEIDQKILDKLSLMLYPESLEQMNKVISILNEDFTFKIEDLFSLKEVSKLFSSKEMLNKYLTHLSKMKNPIISINDDLTNCQLLISDKLVYYQFINIPPEYNDERVKLLLDLKDDDFIRLYKSSIFWVLISDKEEFNNKFEKVLNSTKVDKDEKKLKYNITSAYMIKKMAKKSIEKRIYNQETENLKKKSEKTEKKEESKSKKSDDSMSWRKKSDVSNEQDELGYGYGYGYDKYNKGYKNKRQRFKSDPNEYQSNDYYYNNKKYYYNKNDQNNVEELRSELDEVKYPIFIKEKYTNKDMLDYLAKIKKDICFDEKNFVNIIDDIIDKNKMKNLELENKKEYEVPKNNPLLNFKKGK
jgi:hypothetical protein